MQLDEHANGKEITVSMSDEFAVVLSETRTGGYSWVISKNGKPFLTLLQEESRPNTGAVGGVSHHEWRFQAVAAGEAEIRIRYARSWEKSLEAERTFGLKVRVQS